MPNDVPDWTIVNQVVPIGGISKVILGDVGAAVLTPDSGTESITTSGGPFVGNTLVLASAKAAAGLTIALVGAAGAFTQGTGVSVSPTFGQATTAGNLLRAGVTSSAAEPTTVAAGWVKVKSVNTNGAWAAIWERPNCGNAEAAPVFTTPNGIENMHAQLFELSGAATVNPTDQTASAGSGGLNSLTATASTVDVAFGDLVLLVGRWRIGSAATASFVDSLNNGAPVVHAGDSGASAILAHSSFTFGIIPAATVAQPLGVAPWAVDVDGTSAPAQGSAASVVLAATPGKTYTATDWDAMALQVSGAANTPAVTLKDGTTVRWQWDLSLTATAGTKDQVNKSQQARKGTTGNSMTLAFGAGVANTAQVANLAAYLR